MKGCVLLAITSNSVKVLVVEERDLLREKIAGILSREENISMVIQLSSYSELQTAVGETGPDLVLGDLLKFKIFCKKTGVSAGELCPDANILLYTDEYEQLHRIEEERLSKQRIFNVRRIQQEVRSFLQDAKQKIQSNNIKKGKD